MPHTLERHPFIQQAIQDIKASLAISQQNFNTLYRPIISAFLNKAQPEQSNESNPIPSPSVKYAFLRSIASLQIRRGMMLPPHSDAETCYAQQEAWSYALFIAALWKDYLPDDKLIKKIIPKMGLSWLQVHSDIKKTLKLYFHTLHAIDNTMFQLIIYAEKKLS